MFDIKQEYETAMNHYLELAKLEAFKAQVWRSVTELDEMDGFAGFKIDFLERVKQ